MQDFCWTTVKVTDSNHRSDLVGELKDWVRTPFSEICRCHETTLGYVNPLETRDDPAVHLLFNLIETRERLGPDP